MHYDGLFILNTGGKDEGLPQAIETIEKAIAERKGSVAQVRKMDKRRFERVAGKLDAGFYLNVRFDLEPGELNDLRAQFSRDETVYRQFYLRSEALPEKEEA
ncbi:MAG: 30S ribosomal protein S6 [Verrucomicrobiota bacterium]